MFHFLSRVRKGLLFLASLILVGSLALEGEERVARSRDRGVTTTDSPSNASSQATVPLLPGNSPERIRQREVLFQAWQESSPEEREELLQFLKLRTTPQELLNRSQSVRILQRVPQAVREALLQSLNVRHGAPGWIEDLSDLQTLKDRRQQMVQQLEQLTPRQRLELQDFLTQSAHLTSEERRKRAENLSFFKDMPSEKRQELVTRYLRFMAFPQDIREKILRNFEKWKKLSPEEKQRYREKLARRRAQVHPFTEASSEPD